MTSGISKYAHKRIVAYSRATEKMAKDSKQEEEEELVAEY